MIRNSRPFLVVETGQPVPSMRRHGGFAHWIRTAAGLARGEVEVVNVQAGDAPPAHGEHAGVIVSGSGAMVSDREAWSERTADWLRDAAHGGAPVFGICYGHQLLAHALGGEVADNPRGLEMGTVDLELHPAAGEDPLFTGLPARIQAQATHLQSVIRPPEGAIVLASSTLDDRHAFRWGESAWGVQFHPEFSADHMRGYVRARAANLERGGQDAAAIHAAVRAAPDARRVLRRFVRRARRHA
ncbi:glutamine amidotransferase [Luteimonas sp. MC1895]|uniref:glutamine amidotransferase n=1 Tax=Luteimonas sp. MC1895 TaxID=2819513 RepID=UPI0018F0FD97|nr:glutamine amidotransferase [Luteimonas sp. MC1895]MBJ6979165.1 glutamine amidotransferase [Luteimonas sp. MC1895]